MKISKEEFDRLSDSALAKALEIQREAFPEQIKKYDENNRISSENALAFILDQSRQFTVNYVNSILQLILESDS